MDGRASPEVKQTAELAAITATHVTVESDGRDIIVANSHFVEQTNTQERT
jgi:hypothetical protein